MINNKIKELIEKTSTGNVDAKIKLTALITDLYKEISWMKAHAEYSKDHAQKIIDRDISKLI